MKFGYARISKKDEQDVSAQVAALKQAGCDKTYFEEASGGRWERPELHKLLDQLRPDDIVLVWKLDRLSRSWGLLGIRVNFYHISSSARSAEL